MFRSSDSGENWILTGLTHNTVGALALNSTGDIFAGTSDGGVFRSVESTTAVEEISTNIPSQYALKQNYPNPFNPVTTIEFDVPNTVHIELTMYNVLGKKVETLVSKKYSAGKYRVQWSANNFSSGVYFYQLKAGSFVHTIASVATHTGTANRFFFRVDLEPQLL